MKQRNDRLDGILDDALDSIRESKLDPATERQATDRVWQRLSEELETPQPEPVQAIRDCADFQAMIPAHLAGNLPQARKLLLEDHLGECLPCRKRLRELQSPAATASIARKRKPGVLSTLGFRLAAAAVIFLALVGFSFKTDVLSFESGGMIRIQSVEGELFHFTENGAKPLAEGDTVALKKGEEVRTAKGSTAVLTLADDSMVEMRERSQLAVKQRTHLIPGRRSDGILGLERGSIIVEASDQGSGHLYVDTDDCRVAVTGTVFSVNHGLKGSRVSVIEGEVHVNHAGENEVLQPGDQTTTHPALGRVPVEDEIAWSQNRAEYIALLEEMQALSKEIDRALNPDSRYSTDLLDAVPASTVIYVGVPNVSGQLADAYGILRDRMATNQVLRQYWEKQMNEAGELAEVLEKVRAYGDHLGEEVVITLGAGMDGDVDAPLILARLGSRSSFVSLLEEDLAKLDESERRNIRIIEGDLPAASPGARIGELFFWMPDDMLVVSPSFDRLMELDAARQGFTDATLVGTSFHDRLADRYTDGVEWIVGVDLERLISLGDSEDLQRLGLADVQHLIAERRGQDDMTQQSATLTFGQPRQRMAAWLAEPAPMGALNYVGPDANLAAAFVMKDLGILVDELFDLIGGVDGDSFEQSLAQFEREQGIDVRRDFAAPLGGEFVLALDGPVLPVPSWKLIVEVYDSERFQQTMQWVVEKAHEGALEHGARGVTLETETVGDRTFHKLTSLDTLLSASYTFDDGYVVAAANRGLVERALQQKRSGISVVDSPDFARLLPQDAQVNFSGAFYHNIGPVLAPFGQGLSAAIAGLDEQDRGLVQALSANARPGLALLYGEPDRIVLTANSEGGLFGSSLGSLSGFGGLMGMQQSLMKAAEDHANQSHGR